MGSSASSHGGRRVSFGLDERDQVRVLQGIRITEDVVNRMKRSSISITDIQRSPRASNGTAPSSLAAGVKPKPTGTVGVVLPLQVTEDAGIFQYVEEQALVQEELLWLAKREREAASEAKARNSITEERQKAAQLSLSSPPLDSGKTSIHRLYVKHPDLPSVPVEPELQDGLLLPPLLVVGVIRHVCSGDGAFDEFIQFSSSIESTWKVAVTPYYKRDYAMELERREAELKLQENFYKEQFSRIEKKNAEIYKLTTEQYQEAATKAEERIKRRNADPICANLQSEILKCFRENKHEVLNCSELAKEYQRCVSAAQKGPSASVSLTPRQALWAPHYSFQEESIAIPLLRPQRAELTCLCQPSYCEPEEKESDIYTHVGAAPGKQPQHWDPEEEDGAVHHPLFERPVGPFPSFLVPGVIRQAFEEKIEYPSSLDKKGHLVLT
ncbi:hypothetical protein IHE44_0003525, partial [Lamprotornis superbus]